MGKEEDDMESQALKLPLYVDLPADAAPSGKVWWCPTHHRHASKILLRIGTEPHVQCEGSGICIACKCVLVNEKEIKWVPTT